MKSRLFGAVCACVLATTSYSAIASITTIDAYARGSYHDSAHYTGVSGNAGNTLVGNCASCGASYNGHFSFDLSTLSTIVTSGKLRLELENWFSFDSYEMFTVFDVVTDVNDLNAHHGTFDPRPDIYTDLQSGAIYGNGVAYRDDVGSILEISLSADALADINSSLGGLLAIGVHLDTINTSGDDAIRFALSTEPRIHQLQLTSSPVPIPPALYLFGTGLIGLVGVARRRAQS